MIAESIHLNTVFMWCNDVDAMRRFYTKILGLSENFYQNNAHQGWLSYRIGETQVVFMRANESLPIQTDWMRQAGYAGSDNTAKTWLFTVAHDDFQQISERVRHSEVSIYNECEDYDPSCQLFIKDPMGMTIELCVAS